jgi:crossover junction endodeoxyribonuclease RusA
MARRPGTQKAGAVGVILTITVSGDPIPTARARFVRHAGVGVVYTPKTSKDYQKKISLAVRGATPARGLLGPFRVSAAFHRATRRRVDIDNLFKSVLDGITRSGLWEDDSQVHWIEASLRLGQLWPRLELTVERVEGGDVNGVPQDSGAPEGRSKAKSVRQEGEVGIWARRSRAVRR